MQPNEEQIKIQQKKYLILIAILIVINTIGFAFLVNDGRTISDRFWLALKGNLIGFNMIGFILGAVVAILPYKKLPYKKKYLRSSLLTILIFHVLMTIGLILLIPLILLGRH